jgi:hypothetical protein
MKLSQNLRGEIEKNPDLEIAGPAEDLEFDEVGNLPKLAFASHPAVVGV